MARELLEYYQRELALLYEQAEDFSAEFGGVADRLGGLTKEKMDPGLKGLLEGSAYLAARVQLKLKSEFSEFTAALLDQLLPNYLAPTPSSVLVQAVPNHENPNLAQGLVHAAGEYIDATYVERERRVSCRYRLGGDLVVWPLRIERADYFAGPAPLQAMGLEVLPGTVAGLRLNLMHRTSNPAKDTPETRPSNAPFSTLTLDQLSVHLVGNSIDRDALYEQLFAHCRRITLRYDDAHGDPIFVPLPLKSLVQVGFEEADALLPSDERSFYGFDILREFFTFPAKFQGFRLHGLRAFFGKIQAPIVDILFEFDAVISRLASVVTSAQFALYAAPASNLFEMQCTRIPINRAEHEHQVVADRSRWLDYEVHRIVDVFAHYPGQQEKERVFPLYCLPTNARHPDTALYFTGRRLPRQPTAREKRFGSQTSYAGTETFVSLFEPANVSDANRVKELSVRAMVSNRHLTEQLPVGDTGADFRLTNDTSVALKCIAGPTPPRDSIIHVERRQREATHPGPIMWRLINFLTMSHLGLVDRGPDDKAGGLRELLTLFADITDMLTERQLRGIVSISSRPIVRRLRQETGFNAARGVEISVTFDEKAFEETGVMFLGAALDRFFAEYSSINSFTETVIVSVQRGMVVRWPPRSGMGRAL